MTTTTKRKVDLRNSTTKTLQPKEDSVLALAKMMNSNPELTLQELAIISGMAPDEIERLLLNLVFNHKVSLSPEFFDSALGVSFPKRLLDLMGVDENCVIKFIKSELGIVHLIPKGVDKLV
jgi:hypothetical protein